MPRSGTQDPDASARIDAAIAGLGDWRGELLAEIRAVIHDADPDVLEEVKWVKPSNPAGVPTWTHDGIICTGEVYKAKVKVTFMSGAAVDDPQGLFNSSLDAGTRRAIDFVEGDTLDAPALEQLIKAAVALNQRGAKDTSPREQHHGRHRPRPS